MKKFILRTTLFLILTAMFVSCASTNTEAKKSDEKGNDNVVVYDKANYINGIYKDGYNLVQGIDVTKSINEKVAKPFFHAEIFIIDDNQIFLGSDQSGLLLSNLSTKEEFFNSVHSDCDEIFQYKEGAQLGLGIGIEKKIKINGELISIAFADLASMENGFRVWIKK